MTVSDEKQQNRLVKVWFGYPDVEIRTQDFPFVVIDLVSLRAANDRQHSGIVVDNDYQGTVAKTVVATNGTQTVYKSFVYEVPVAYDLVYQVSSYSRHPLHDRAIMYQMTQKFPSKYGYLPVPNALGTETAYRHMFVDSVAKRDMTDNVNGARRLLNNVYTIRVMSEMTPATETSGTAPSALLPITGVGINTTPLQYPVPQGKQSI